MERDLEADLRLCDQATPGPWLIGKADSLRLNELPVWADGFPLGAFYSYTRSGVIETPANAAFAIAAREGWPYAIRLALKLSEDFKSVLTTCAEKDGEIARLRALLEPFARIGELSNGEGRTSIKFVVGNVAYSQSDIIGHCRAARNELGPLYCPPCQECDRLSVEINRLRALLKPFAARPDSTGMLRMPRLTLDDCRKVYNELRKAGA